MPPKPVVVVGMLGPTLDQGKAPRRWDRWRPTVALCQHEDLVVSRLELLHAPRHASLTEVVARDIAIVSPETTVHPVSLVINDPWDFEEVYAALHDFAMGYAFVPEAEDYLVHITTGTHVAQICMFLLTEARYIPGRLLQTAPPKGSAPGRTTGLADPGAFAIIDLDLSRYDRLASRFQKAQEQAQSFLKSGIATQNAAYNRTIERIEQVAIASSAPILFTGPTGAGKSALARKVFELKKARRQVRGDLCEVNCATLRGDAAMSALFGHVKGAFTGALSDRTGLLRRAHGGVLFLDEVGELGLDEQAMLLGAIEQKVFFPMGSDREVRSDFQLIAGTNRDLVASVRDRSFREDLYARINLWSFRLPGLAERPEDIEPNLAYELDLATKNLGVRVTMSREARSRFLEFATSKDAQWKGNFRDLNAAITRMATLASGGRITTHAVGEEEARLNALWGERWDPEGYGDEIGEPRSSVKRLEPGLNDTVTEALGSEAAAQLDPFDRVQLSEVLRVCQVSRSLSEAGRVLFATSRATKRSTNDADRLRKYLTRFGLDFQRLGARAT